MSELRLGERLESGFVRFGWRNSLSLTTRILAVNILPLALLGGGIFYIDSYRNQLLAERYKLARIEAQITAEALAGASRERQEALLVQIGKEQHMRLRMFDAEGQLWADSFALDKPAFDFTKPIRFSFGDKVAIFLDHAVDTIVGAKPVPDYVEPRKTPGNSYADAWPELREARRTGLSQIKLRDRPDGTPVINAAAPVGLRGATLLTTRHAVDITDKVRQARSTLFFAVIFALAASILLSLFLARTIVMPLRLLARAAARVRLGREREVEVPRLPERRDEIGLLARSVSDMTSALRMRIDAVESFAADVAHEIKNPLASLRSAVESLAKVEDPELRHQLLDIANHDVRRIDRLVTEISDASKIDAEMSRAKLERLDLARLVTAIIGSREARARGQELRVVFDPGNRRAIVLGMPQRLERVVTNLLDNAASFSSRDKPIEIALRNDGAQVILSVCDHGPGIPQSEREKVFARFHSVRPETEGFGNHSGLGLAIARTIAEAHDGTLKALPRADGQQGACLELALPAAR